MCWAYLFLLDAKKNVELIYAFACMPRPVLSFFVFEAHAYGEVANKTYDHLIHESYAEFVDQQVGFFL